MQCVKPADRRKLRIGFVASHPIQYLAPLYQAINRTADLEAIPIYLTDFSLRRSIDPLFGTSIVWDIDLLAGTNPLFVPGFQKREPNGFSIRHSAPSILPVVLGARLDALVVHGHSMLANHFATLAARMRRLPVFYHCDAPLAQARGGALRSVLLRAFYRSLNGFLASSSSNRDYYRALDVPDHKIHHFPFAVDNERFAKSAMLNDEQRLSIRQELGLRVGVPTIVTASKLVAQKRLADLIEAAIQLRHEGLDFDLLLIGSGHEQASLERIAANAPGAPILFAGFRNQKEMPALFASSDMFVMTAANENFGLVINEAMCAGLPVVASTGIGAVCDLVRDGENGRIFEVGDQAGLAEALRSLITDPGLRQRMGGASRSIIGRWSYNEDIAGLRAALSAADVSR